MSTNNIFTPLINRLMVQVQFRPTLKWLGNKSIATHSLEDKYKEWVVDKDGNIALYSPDDKCALEVFTRQITFVTEDDTKTNDGIKNLKLVLKEAISRSGISELRRVGCRRTMIYKSSINFSEITDHIYKKFYIIEHKLQEGKVKDLAYALDTVDQNNIKTHVQIGAVNKDQAIQYFESKFVEKTNIDSNDNLFFDIDVSSSEELEVRSVESRIGQVVDLCNKTVESYLEFVKK